jgi:Flp pilus assembly protein TadD
MQQQTDFHSPETAEATRAVSRAMAVGDYQQARDVAEGALAKGLIHPALFNARALWLERQGRDEEALADFERAVSLAPRNPVLLNAIGLCLTRLQRLEEAVSAFDEAIRIDPTFTATYHRKGIALGMAGDRAGAKRAQEQAARLNPRDASALASLASLAAQGGDMKKASGYAERALKLDPREPTAMAALALVDNAAGSFVEAEQAVRPLLDRPELFGHARAAVLGVLADSLDGQNRVVDAFDAYRSENEELRRLHGRRFAGMRSVTEYTRDLVSYFHNASDQAWRAHDDGAPTDPDQPRQHVFLLGFYRSGTTLLRQVLATHSEIVTLEERDFLLSPAANYLSDDAGLARLLALSGEALAEERNAYWRRIGESGLKVGGKVFVDKHPMNTIKLPLIARLFPRARIVVAVRDPRDVVLSCFRRHFEINAGMFDLLTLEGAATLYDVVMQFADLVQPLLGLPFFTHRYEDMISDFEGQIGALCNFLEVPFEPGMREFHSRTSVQDIRSPSASQVRRALNRESVEQWRRYHAPLSAVLPLLRPWIEKFDYPAE